MRGNYAFQGILLYPNCVQEYSSLLDSPIDFTGFWNRSLSQKSLNNLIATVSPENSEPSMEGKKCTSVNVHLVEDLHSLGCVNFS
jgi:hypothetical protein